MPKSKKTSDLLGLAPYGEAVNAVTKGVLDGMGAFLSRICLPAAEEFGLLLQDKISNWRKNNVTKIVSKAKDMVENNKCNDTLHAHPRLVMKIFEEGSWADNDEVQSMWAGLLVSSCTKCGKDESNLLFVDLLRQMTTSEAKLFDYFCKSSLKYISTAGFVTTSSNKYSLSQLINISGNIDLEMVKLELDHLKSLQIVSSYFLEVEDTLVAHVGVTGIGLNLYARCNGNTGSLNNFFSHDIRVWS